MHITKCKTESQWEFAAWYRELNLVLCDNLEGGMRREEGGRFKMEGTYVYLWLIHVDIWQRPTQHCKAIIFQFKNYKKTYLKSHILNKIFLDFQSLLPLSSKALQ